VVVVEPEQKCVLFAIGCNAVIGWTVSESENGFVLYFDLGECIFIRLKTKCEVNCVIRRLEYFTKGCKTNELCLEKKDYGQLGFNIHHDGVLADVEPYSLAHYRGLKQGTRIVKIGEDFVINLNHEKMIALLTASKCLKVTYIQPHEDGSARSGQDGTVFQLYAYLSTCSSTSNERGIDSATTSSIKSGHTQQPSMFHFPLSLNQKGATGGVHNQPFLSNFSPQKQRRLTTSSNIKKIINRLSHSGSITDDLPIISMPATNGGTIVSDQGETMAFANTLYQDRSSAINNNSIVYNNTNRNNANSNYVCLPKVGSYAKNEKNKENSIINSVYLSPIENNNEHQQMAKRPTPRKLSTTQLEWTNYVQTASKQLQNAQKNNTYYNEQQRPSTDELFTKIIAPPPQLPASDNFVNEFNKHLIPAQPKQRNQSCDEINELRYKLALKDKELIQEKLEKRNILEELNSVKELYSKTKSDPQAANTSSPSLIHKNINKNTSTYITSNQKNQVLNSNNIDNNNRRKFHNMFQSSYVDQTDSQI
jgi:hypothetical protein